MGLSLPKHRPDERISPDTDLMGLSLPTHRSMIGTPFKDGKVLLH